MNGAIMAWCGQEGLSIHMEGLAMSQWVSRSEEEIDHVYAQVNT